MTGHDLHRMGTLTCAAIALLAVLGAKPSRGAAPGPPLTSDALVLARWVDAVGDDAALAALGEERSAAEHFAAALSTPYLSVPELALVPLAALAGGRDPDVAPVAAAAAVAIVEELSLPALARRETQVKELEPALRAFVTLERVRGLRPDIALQVSQVASQLEMLTGIDLSDDHAP